MTAMDAQTRASHATTLRAIAAYRPMLIDQWVAGIAALEASQHTQPWKQIVPDARLRTLLVDALAAYDEQQLADMTTWHQLVGLYDAAEEQR